MLIPLWYNIKNLYHEFQHLIGTNSGNLEGYKEEGIINLRFKCSCGKIFDATEAYRKEMWK